MKFEFAVVSDTHWSGPNADLDRLVHRLYGAQRIIHLGDAVSPAILQALEQVAPLWAVQGNCCYNALRESLPRLRTETFEGLSIGMTHGHLLDTSDGPALLEYFPAARLVMHGHTHMARLEIHQDRVVFNPGSVSEPRHGTPPSYGWGSWDGAELKMEHRIF